VSWHLISIRIIFTFHLVKSLQKFGDTLCVCTVRASRVRVAFVYNRAFHAETCKTALASYFRTFRSSRRNIKLFVYKSLLPVWYHCPHFSLHLFILDFTGAASN
jgi:hypothetical protein